MMDWLTRQFTGAMPPGGGSPAGGAAFDAGIMPMHGGMSNAPGGAGDPGAYAGAPPAAGMTDMQKLMLAKAAGGLGGQPQQQDNSLLAALLAQGGQQQPVQQAGVLAPNAGTMANMGAYAPFARR